MDSSRSVELDHDGGTVARHRATRSAVRTVHLWSGGAAIRMTRGRAWREVWDRLIGLARPAGRHARPAGAAR